MPNPILSSPHQTRSLPRTQHPLSSPRSHPDAPARQNRPSLSSLQKTFPLPRTKHTLASPRPHPDAPARQNRLSLSSLQKTFSLPRAQHPLASPRSHPNAPDRQNRRSSPSYRRPSFQFGHLGTCLFCPFFGHFKHVPMCPKLQDISLSFASFLFLSQIFPRACDFP